MKYIFKQIDNISGHCAETTVEFSADSLPDILEHFEMFLRGSGFHFSGNLDFSLDFVSNEEHDMPQFEPAAEEEYDNNQVCGRCGLTKGQLGTNICYDMKCGFNDN